MWAAILFFLSLLVALAGAYRAFSLSRSTGDKKPWLVTSAALLLFAGLSGLLTYYTIDTFNPLELAAGSVALVAALLASTGVHLTGQRMQALRQSEGQSRQSDAFFRSLFEHLPNPIVFKDRDEQYQAANPAFQSFLGKDNAEILGKKDADFFPRPQANAFLQTSELAIQQAAPQVQEQEVIGSSGRKWLQIIYIPIANGDGTASGVLVASQDITERKQLERELEERKMLLGALVEEKQQVIEKNRQSIEEMNSMLRFERLLASFAAFFIDADAARINQGLQHALRSIGLHTATDYCSLLLFGQEGAGLKAAYEWYAADVSRDQVSRWEDSSNPPWTSLGQMQVTHVSSIVQLPAEAREVADFMQAQGIKAFVAVPLISERSVIGYLWLEARKKELAWNNEFLELLKTAGQIFVHTLDRKRKVEQLAETQQTMQHRLALLEQHSSENVLLKELGDLLQICRTVDEAYPIIARYAQQLVPVGSGALYLMHEVDEPVENVAAWGETPPAEAELAVNECWALRRGRLHLVSNSAKDLNCAHLKPPLPPSYLCAPLIAQGETIGLLHLRFGKGDPSRRLEDLEDSQRLSVMIAEHIALALSNLSLRDKLRSQAIRDPLTGLFNRRYMEETLDREIRRAVRHTIPVSVILFDIDHLKRVNDSYGHDAGDAALEALGNLMLKTFRGEDVPCRFGGDEFTIILPEATVSDAFRRAEQFREAFKGLEFEHEGKHFGPLTLSLGIAAYPDHGSSVERLLQIADAATYAAKAQGRDRVMIGGVVEE
jgi:diguanylate cyclase (GGDEF)-like protein/PAS domain S-box-containing protein